MRNKDKMELIKVKNYRELSERAFQVVSKEISKKPNLVIGFASGKTPVGLYRRLIKAYRRGKLDFSKVKAFNLDEHYPMEKENKKSYAYYLSKILFNKINIKKENINLLNGGAKNANKECKDYENKIKKNPIDIQILGLGTNGHIAFNEPGSDFRSKTRLINLSPETIKEKKLMERALTMGISTIMKSKKIILLASGKKKAEAVRALMKGKIDKKYPVGFLKKHKNLLVIVDEKASSSL